MYLANWLVFHVKEHWGNERPVQTKEQYEVPGKDITVQELKKLGDTYLTEKYGAGKYKMHYYLGIFQKGFYLDCSQMTYNQMLDLRDKMNMVEIESNLATGKIFVYTSEEHFLEWFPQHQNIIL